MSVTIDLPPDIEASLAAQAEAQGVPLAEHLRRLLVAQASGSGARETPAERVKLWRDVRGLPDTKPLSDEAISRESIYSEREENGAITAELLTLGRDCAARLKEPWRSADHAELLYNARECHDETIRRKTIMSVTIDLPPDTEARLAAQAAELGVPLTQHLRRLLEEHAAPSKPARKTLEERVKLWRDVSGLPDTEPLSDEAISRESIYAERG